MSFGSTPGCMYSSRMRFLLFLILPHLLSAAEVPDPRHLSRGHVIPDESYADQPYLVQTGDGAWLCVLTTGSGVEGATGQHIISTRSTDRGRTWSPPVDVEPASGPEASYAVLLKAPSGRIFVFYNHNTDNVRALKADNPPYSDGLVRRVDSFGHFVFKYSDDHGRSWSPQRYEIPQRDFEIDIRNPYAGKTKFFWNVGRAFSHNGAAYVPLHKVGGFGEGFFTSSEGVLLHSPNLLTEPDPARVQWETLPTGTRGIRSPEPNGGPIAEEHSFSVLSDGSFFCVFRTIDGHAAYSYSRDRGRTWEPSQYMRYADGRLMKHPRAANFAWRTQNGKFLYWFHNHGGRFLREHPRRRTIAYEDRNPVWLSGGVEADSPRGKIIRWSQPEIALYDDDPWVRISYPDLIEEDGRYFLTETQKEIARVHELDPTLLEGLWNQGHFRTVSRAGLLLETTPTRAPIPLPELPAFTRRIAAPHIGEQDLRAGFSLDAWILYQPNQILLTNRTAEGKGFTLASLSEGRLELTLSDGRTESRWTSDPDALLPGRLHHIVATVDGGPKIITFVTDAKLHDGGEARQFGWGRYDPHLRSLAGEPQLRAHSSVRHLRLYGRALRTSEAIAHFHAGPPKP